MNTIRTQSNTFHRLFDGLHGRAAAALATLRRIRTARHARAVTQQLLTFDDRMLYDIGVSRSDVEQALAVAWDADPAVALAEVRRRRLQADRQGMVQRRVR